MKLSNFPSFSHLVLLNRALAKKFQGKSRADLWELAALVALDLTVERANRACDLDFHARHQVFWLAYLGGAHTLLYPILLTGDPLGKQREV